MIILDCEASGLCFKESYPIQVGWVDSETEEKDSFFIRPSDDWNYWNWDAQDVHNIPRKTLFDVGLTVDVAAKRLLPILEREGFIFSDAPEFDSYWVNKLMNLVFPEFKVPEFKHVVYLLEESVAQRKMFNILVNQKRPHDALDDALMMKKAYKEALFGLKD